jgi:toxin ParE1/3/4
MIQFSKTASADILSIEQFSYSQWGHKRTVQYFEKLHNALSAIQGNPRLGKARPDIDEECRAYPVRKHIIPYRVLPEGVEIGRIIRSSMSLNKISSGFSDAAQAFYRTG